MQYHASASRSRRLPAAIGLLVLFSGSPYAVPRAAFPDPTDTCPAYVRSAEVRAVEPQEDDPVADFRKYFRRYEDTATRVEAVLALADLDRVGVAEVLLPVLEDEAPPVAAAAVEVLGGLRTEEALAPLAAVLEKERKGARLIGVLAAVKGGRQEYLTAGVVRHLRARDWQVRRQAVLARTALAGAAAAEELLPLAADEEVAVRCAVLDGLADLGVRAVLPAAQADLAHESWQVRASAIRALGLVRDRSSLQLLVDALGREEGRLIEDAALALERLTGERFGLRVEAWQRFWATWKDRYELPSEADLAQRQAVREANAERYGRPGDASFGGLDSPSRRLLFVIDVSGSMEDEVVDTARFRAAGHTAFRRIDIVKEELTRTVRALDPTVQFNILTFATEVTSWKKKLTRANVLNASNAADWIADLEPVGGRSKEDLHRVGLVGTANLAGGKTNTHLALMTALGVLPAGRRAPDYRVPVDTVFFLSDGLPSMGELVEIEDLLRAVRVENQLRRIRLHTIGIGSFQKDFLRRLAEENGGRFVDLGE